MSDDRPRDAPTQTPPKFLDAGFQPLAFEPLPFPRRLLAPV